MLGPGPVAQIARVSAQSIATVRQAPALVATKDVAQIAEVSLKSIGTVDIRPAPVATVEVAPIVALSVRSSSAEQGWLALAPGKRVTQLGGGAAQSLAPSHERLQQRQTIALAQTVVSAQGIANVQDELPPLLAPIAIAPILAVSTQSIAVIDEVPAPVAPMTACERIWDQMTHMSRDEWAEACRRVDELRLVVRN